MLLRGRDVTLAVPEVVNAAPLAPLDDLPPRDREAPLLLLPGSRGSRLGRDYPVLCVRVFLAV